MVEGARAPSAAQVIRAIARREIGIASRRKLVRLLFLFSLIPPLVLTVILVVNVFIQQSFGLDLGWDPLLTFLQIQAFPVALLALGLGTPSVARDRAEEVLFLYATRPVLPWHYALGKHLAVAVPAAALMLTPGILIAILRLAVVGEIGTGGAFDMVLKLVVCSVILAWGYAGVSVGPSALARKARWALLLGLACFVLPDAFGQTIPGLEDIVMSPGTAIEELLATLFDPDESSLRGLISFTVLLVYGCLGFWLTTVRVRREMIP